MNPDCLGDNSFDSTQPRGWYVSITLKMQRAYHPLGGNTVSWGKAEPPYPIRYGAVAHEDHVLGITSVYPMVSFCADCRLQRSNLGFLLPISLS